MSIWDDPSLQVGGNYVKFENVGDSVQGELLSVGIHKWADGSVSPQLIIRTDEIGENGDKVEKTVTAGQIRLKAELADKKPEAGDQIRITLTDIEKRQGGKTLKIFEVLVKKATATPTPTADLLRDKLGATQVSAPF